VVLLAALRPGRSGQACPHASAPARAPGDKWSRDAGEHRLRHDQYVGRAAARISEHRTERREQFAFAPVVCSGAQGAEAPGAADALGSAPRSAKASSSSTKPSSVTANPSGFPAGHTGAPLGAARRDEL